MVDFAPGIQGARDCHALTGFGVFPKCCFRVALRVQSDNGIKAHKAVSDMGVNYTGTGIGVGIDLVVQAALP